MVEELQRCTYVLPLKKRKCRMLVKKGKLFCGEHAIFDPEQTVCATISLHIPFSNISHSTENIDRGLNK